MGGSKIVIAETREKSKRTPLVPDLGATWELLGWLGLLFLVMGFADLVLAWIPFELGNPEWEFGTISATLDRLPLPTMGVVFMLGAAFAGGVRWLARTAAIALWVGAAVIVLLALLYLTNVPLALGSVENPVILLGLKKAVAKAGVQAVVYPVGFVWLGFRAWRASGTGARAVAN